MCIKTRIWKEEILAFISITFGLVSQLGFAACGHVLYFFPGLCGNCLCLQIYLEGVSRECIC